MRFNFRRARERLRRAIGAGLETPVSAGVAWSNAALADLAAMDPDRQRSGWGLLAACQAGGSGKLTARWAKEVRGLVAAVGRDEFRARILRWFPLVDRPGRRTRTT